MILEDDKVVLEKKQLFSKSMLWDIQRSYYEKSGIQAWGKNGVPFYATSNSLIARAYAKLAIAILEDLSKKSMETVYFLELGTGHGRFSFYFLRHFTKLYRDSVIQLPKFCYILSDFVETNIAFWQKHPKLKPYIERGEADTCLFDIQCSDALILRNSGTVIDSASITQPLIVVANYIFDTIPQELFYIDNKEIYNCFVSTSVKNEDYAPDMPISPNRLLLKYEYEKMCTLSGATDNIHKLLDYYKELINDSHILFPFSAIECLDRLNKLSENGLILITSDKGSHHLHKESAPMPVPHGKESLQNSGGCFSFSVNYHVFIKYCENMGGIAMFPDTDSESINIGCLILTDVCHFSRTILAYENGIQRTGPDVCYGVTKSILKNDPTGRNILYLICANQYDPEFFMQISPLLYSLPNLMELRYELFNMIPHIWDMAYELNNDYDLAHELGALLFHLAFYKEAVYYLKQSPYSNEESILQDILFCYYKKKDYDNAIKLLEDLKAINQRG